MNSRQQLPANLAYMSPGQALVRTHSSPSIIDSSPKTNNVTYASAACPAVAITPSPLATSVSARPVHGQKRSHSLVYTAGSPTVGLTPIANNRTRSRTVDGPGNIQGITLPESNSRFSMILPRKDEVSEYNPSVELQPVSPPHWPTRTPSDTIVVAPAVLEQRHESPLPATIHLERNSRSVIQQNRYTSPEKQHIFAENPVPYEPYQPDRHSRLESYGIIRDNAESIFLSSHPIDTRRSGQHTSEADDNDMMDDDVSIPSIRLARSLPSGNDSYTAFSGEDSKDDSSDEEEEPDSTFRDNAIPDIRWGCFPEMQLNVVNALSAQNILKKGYKKPASNTQTNKDSSSSRKKASSRYMSPEKEREVFDWLHSLEIDKDNNEFIAEAASSKFLTGKLDPIDSSTPSHDMYASQIQDPTRSPSVFQRYFSDLNHVQVDSFGLSTHSTHSQEIYSTQLQDSSHSHQSYMSDLKNEPIEISAEAEPEPCPSSIPQSFFNKSTATPRGEVERPSRQVMGRRINISSARTKAGSGRRKVLRSCSGM